MHQRIAISTTSLALVAVAATLAFKAGPSHSDTVSVASTSSNVSVSPGKSVSAQTVSADPRKVVPAAWLSAGQLPFASTFGWKVQEATSQGAPIGQPLTPSVYYVANDTSLQSLTMCSDPSWLLPRTTGAQHSEYLATTGTGNNQASQFLFFFSSHDAAQLTFNNIIKQYGAGTACQQYDGGVQPVLTAPDTSQIVPLDEMVWLTVKGKATVPDMPDYTREYFVLRGNVISYVAVTSYTDTKLPTAYNDTAQLATIASHLCVYGGACK